MRTDPVSLAGSESLSLLCLVGFGELVLTVRCVGAVKIVENAKQAEVADIVGVVVVVEIRLVVRTRQERIAAVMILCPEYGQCIPQPGHDDV